jgi:5-methylcytosine-specific restriction endonuclease McrA
MHRPLWTTPKWREVRRTMFIDADFTCRLCGWRLSNPPDNYDGATMLAEVVAGKLRCLEMDHTVARTKGGSNDAGNLRVACSRCNGSKGDRDDSEWQAWRDEPRNQRRPAWRA